MSRTATEDYVNSRLVPIESEVGAPKGTVEPIEREVNDLQMKLWAQDADLKAAEKRFEEIAQKAQKLEKTNDDSD